MQAISVEIMLIFIYKVLYPVCVVWESTFVDTNSSCGGTSRPTRR